MATDDAIVCSVGMGSHKNIKNWREGVKYLHSADRARFLWCNGFVLTLNTGALRQKMDKANPGQRQRSEISVGCSSYGVAHPSVFNTVETVKPEDEGKG